MIKNYFTIFKVLVLLCFSFAALAMGNKDDQKISTLRHRKLAVDQPPAKPKETDKNFFSVLPIEIQESIVRWLCQDQKILLKAATVCRSWNAVAEKICNEPNQPYPKYVNLWKLSKPDEYSFIMKFLINQYNVVARLHGSHLMSTQPPQTIVYTSYEKDVDLFSQPKNYWISGKFLKEVLTFSKKKEQEGRGGCVYFDAPCDPFFLKTDITSSGYEHIEDYQLFRAFYSSSGTASWEIEGKMPYGKTFFLNFIGDVPLD